MSLFQHCQYRFRNERLLRAALDVSGSDPTNGIYTMESSSRLAFLGQKVLYFLSTEYLHNTYRALLEGNLSTLRTEIQDEERIAEYANQIYLPQIIAQTGQQASHGDNHAYVSVFYALIAAYFEDGGQEAAREFVLPYLQQSIQRSDNECKILDNVVALARILEKVDKTGVQCITTPQEHGQGFKCQIISGKKLIGEGTGGTREAAHQSAAGQAVDAYWVTI